MGRQFTPEEIRDIGARACPAVADSYGEVEPWVRWADGYKDRIFGTHGNGAIWISLFDLLKLAVTETPVSINAMGRALVEVADNYDDDEQGTVVDLTSALDDIEDAFDDHREAIHEEKAEEAAAEEHAREAEEAARSGGGHQFS